MSLMNCYRHPKVETSLRCSRCEKPICADCAILTPVGYRCRECGKERSATHTLEPRQLALGLTVGFGLPFATGFAANYVPLGFFLIFIGAAVGSAMGQVVRRVIGMKSSQLLATVSVSGYLLGALATPISQVVRLKGDVAPLTGVLAYPWPLVFAGVAAVSTAVQLK